MEPKKNPFKWIIGVGVGIVLLLTSWLTANRNWDVSRDQPVPDARIRY